VKHLLALILLIGAPALLPAASTNSLPDQLTLAQAVNLALRQNTTILKAQAELRRTHGLVVEARSEILPHLGTVGEFRHQDQNLIDRFPFGGATIYNNQETPWAVTIEATQTLYAGGRVIAGIRSAKLTDQAALLDFDRTVADTVLDVRRNFYRILLAQSLVVVREQSVALLEQQLTDAKHRFDAGTIPRFNVLRAEVELANAKPPLIRAQYALRLSRENLAKTLAIDTPDTFTPIKFTGELTYEPRDWNLPSALAAAVANRPELQAAAKRTGAARQQIKVAQAGNLPILSAFAGYQVADSAFGSDLNDTVNGWLVGGRVRWDLFDGLRTRGQIAQARAQEQQAELDSADIRRTIELEVRQAYADYLQAFEMFATQKKTVEVAEESLRLANARFQAGTDTQLDVLSAQTALTEARSNEIQALYDYNVADAALERATGKTVRFKP